MARTKKTVKEDVSEATDLAAQNAASLDMKPSDASPKMVTMAQLMDIFQQLSKEDALNLLNVVLSSIGQEAATVPNDAAARNAASVAMKPSDAVGGMREAIKEDIAALFGSDENLNEEFKEKATVLFEAALNVREKLIREELETEYKAKEEKLETEYADVVSEAVTELADVVDKYVTYAAEHWIEQNQVAIDESLDAEINSDLIEAIHGAFDSLYCTVPQAKRDLAEEAVKKYEELEKKYNEVIKENIDLKESRQSIQRDEIFDEMTEGMTMLQKEQLRVLAEGVEAETDEDFRKKVAILKESSFKPSKKKATGILAEHLDGIDDKSADDVRATKVVPAEVRSYVDFIAATVKK